MEKNHYIHSYIYMYVCMYVCMYVYSFFNGYQLEVSMNVVPQQLHGYTWVIGHKVIYFYVASQFIPSYAWRFPKIVVPQLSSISRWDFPYKPPILGYSHLWKPIYIYSIYCRYPRNKYIYILCRYTYMYNSRYCMYIYIMQIHIVYVCVYIYTYVYVYSLCI